MKRPILIWGLLLIASGAMAQSRCVTAPVNVTGNQVTITTTGDKSVTDNRTYVYYGRQHHRRHLHADDLNGVTDKFVSRPLLLDTREDIKALPETYSVSLNTPDNNVAVCPDSQLNLTTGLSVEKVSSYTGNYPGTTDNNVYKKVSKHHYKMVARKLRKIKKNEERVARRTKMNVEVHADKA